MPPHFTGLPQEIRDAILELCLVVEGPINPYPTFFHDRNPFEKTSRKPDVALLTVNKSINAEASMISYGSNVWKINWRSEDYPRVLDSFLQTGFTDDLEVLPRDQIWTTNRAQIRHITLDLDVRELVAAIYLHPTEVGYERGPGETVSVERMEMTHTQRRMILGLFCAWKFRVIGGMQLRSAWIDVKKLSCSGGCCRSGLMRSACYDHLRKLAAHGKIDPVGQNQGPLERPSMPTVTVVGLRNREELAAGRDWWEEWYGNKLDYVTDKNGLQIGLTGFHEINKRKPDCS